MSGKLFGTDGVRGIPGREPLTAATIRALAYHGARVLLEKSGVKVNGRSPRIAIAVLDYGVAGYTPDLNEYDGGNVEPVNLTANACTDQYGGCENIAYDNYPDTQGSGTPMASIISASSAATA